MNWDEIKTNFLKIFNTKEEEENFLLKLITNIEFLEESKKNVPFRIIEVKEKGFLVKVGGLFAYVSFHHMPWRYTSNENWKAVSKFLIGKSFFCNIYQVKRNPLSILVNGEIHRFNDVKINLYQEYKGLVIGKSKYGVFIDIGEHFNWEFGSLVGLIHISSFKDFDTFERIKVGTEICSIFYGYTEEGKLIFGDKIFQKEWFTGELNSLIGTIQNIKVIYNSENKKEFYVNEVYKATIPITKLMYPDQNKTKAKKIIRNLTENQILNCEITSINKRKKHFVLKLNLENEKYNV